jgi:hypothetical protein
MNAKQRWNSEHYQQLNISLKKDLATEFKNSCSKREISIAGEIARLIKDDLAITTSISKKVKTLSPKYNTRLQRRKGIQNIVKQLEEIIVAEIMYQESIPEQLQECNGVGIDDAVAVLENVIDDLNNIDIYPESPRRKVIKR